jgi:predicted nucleic acid-binding protein
MIILDTSVWIEFLRNNSLFFPPVKHLLERQQALGLEWIFGELLQGAADKREREIILSYWENIPKFDSTGIWIKAGLFSSEEKLSSRGVGLIDCAIIIACRQTNSTVWSLDKKLNNVLPENQKYLDLGY